MSTPKYIAIPAPVQLTQSRSGPLLFSLADLVAHIVDQSPRFQRPTSAVRAGVRILAAFDVAKDETIELRGEDWTMLHEIAESSDFELPALTLTDANGVTSQQPVPARLFLPLIDAIDCATNSPPKKPTPELEKE